MNTERKVLPRVVCKDGFSVSIQGGYGMYSKPRRDIPWGVGYKELELGFPSQEDEVISEWAELYKEGLSLTEAVYPYVPIEVVALLILKHGGVDETFIKSAGARVLFEQSSPFLAVWRVLLKEAQNVRG